MNCDVGPQTRLGSGVAVAMARPAAAPLIQPLPWELAYAAGVTLKDKKKKKKERKKKKKKPHINTLVENLSHMPRDVPQFFFFNL